MWSIQLKFFFCCLFRWYFTAWKTPCITRKGEEYWPWNTTQVFCSKKWSVLLFSRMFSMYPEPWESVTLFLNNILFFSSYFRFRCQEVHLCLCHCYSIYIWSTEREKGHWWRLGCRWLVLKKLLMRIAVDPQKNNCWCAQNFYWCAFGTCVFLDKIAQIYTWAQVLAALPTAEVSLGTRKYRKVSQQQVKDAIGTLSKKYTKYHPKVPIQLYTFAQNNSVLFVFGHISYDICYMLL